MSNEQTLTETQENVLDYITDYYGEHSVVPTYREIRDYFGWQSMNSVTTHLLALKRKGRLKSLEGRRGYVPA